MKMPFLLCGLLYSSFVLAQLKTTPICPDFVVDILDGRIGELDPRSTIGQVKEKFPCFTSTEDESVSSRCGGGVFYKTKDIYFYTARNYIEIGPAFKGKLSIPLMGANRNNLFRWLGHPMIKDVSWDCFETSYGILLLYYDKANKVNRIRFSTESAGSIKLCE
ncbi:MAG TPA: hypothetical protein VIV35_04115 [Chitinophagaceae bacterium]